VVERLQQQPDLVAVQGKLDLAEKLKLMTCTVRAASVGFGFARILPVVARLLADEE
jgi:hypothetical protein